MDYEIVEMAIQTRWGETHSKWVETQFVWGHLLLAKLITLGGGGFVQWQNLNPVKKKKLIQLYCKILGKEYNESKYKSDYTLSIKQAKLILREVKKQNISVNVIFD